MTDELIIRTTEFFRGDVRRIQHFMKVYTYAALIGRMEGLDDDTMRVLEAAAVVHDTGIKKPKNCMDIITGNCRNNTARRQRMCY